MSLRDVLVKFGQVGAARWAVVFLIGFSLSLDSARAADPCCVVVSLNAPRGVVVARDTKTGRTFQFSVGGNVIQAVKVGDPVEANIASLTVTSVKGITGAYKLSEPDTIAPCCAITGLPPAASPPTRGFDPDNGMVTARNKTTGKTFQFLVEGASLLRSLTVGQAVSVDATGKWALFRSNAATYSFSLR